MFINKPNMCRFKQCSQTNRLYNDCSMVCFFSDEYGVPMWNTAHIADSATSTSE